MSGDATPPADDRPTSPADSCRPPSGAEYDEADLTRKNRGRALVELLSILAAAVVRDIAGHGNPLRDDDSSP